MNLDDRILTFRQTGQVKLKCTIRLDRLFESKIERERFNKRWSEFVNDDCNKAIYRLKGDRLMYDSEQLVPTKSNDKPAVLLVLGNPASESVKNGMFFSTKNDGRELRFWTFILEPAGLLPPLRTKNLPANTLNQSRKKQLWNLDYNTPYRIGLCVFISMPSAAGGKWGGVAGVQKLIGAKALKKLEKEETYRIIEAAEKFVRRKGAVITFQRNAWESLRSDKGPKYCIDDARKGKLKGTLKGAPHIPLFGVPPTRLLGPSQSVLRKFLAELKK
jgi:hypothetical protein